MGTSASSNLQDILRLLTLWFSYGAAPDVEAALAEGFGHVSIDTWLVVIPQVIARIHTSSVPVRRLIHSLLVRRRAAGGREREGGGARMGAEDLGPCAALRHAGQPG